MVLLQGPTGWRFLISEVLLSDNCVGVEQRKHAFAPVLLQGGLRDTSVFKAPTVTHIRVMQSEIQPGAIPRASRGG